MADNASITHPSDKFHENRSNKTKSLAQASEMELMNQAFHNMEHKALNPNCQNLNNGLERIFVNMENGLIHIEDETFDLQKWIDKQIDSNSQLYSLDVHKKTSVANIQFESYFNSKFNKKDSNLQDIVKGHLSEKTRYKKEKGVYLQQLEKTKLDSKDIAIGLVFEEPKPNENGVTLDSKYNSLDELNKSKTNLDKSTYEDDDEPYDYKDLSDDFSDIEDGLSLQELRSLNKSCEQRQLHSQRLYDLPPSEGDNCINFETHAISLEDDGCSSNFEEGCKFKVGIKIPIEIRDKLRFEKTLFYDSISSVQPYFQDNLEGPISQPRLKVESARVSNIQGISPCSSPKPSLKNRSLKHQDFKRLMKRSGSLKEIVIDSKELTMSNGVRNLPKEIQDFFEKMKGKSSLRLSKYQKVSKNKLVYMLKSIDVSLFY